RSMNLEIRSASRDGGNDADLVVLGHRSGQVVEVANVLVVEVDIDEAAQFLAVEEPLAEGGKCGSQVRENLAHGRARRLDPILAPGVGAQGSGYSYRCHGVILHRDRFGPLNVKAARPGRPLTRCCRPGPRQRRPGAKGRTIRPGSRRLLGWAR